MSHWKDIPNKPNGVMSQGFCAQVTLCRVTAGCFREVAGEVEGGHNLSFLYSRHTAFIYRHIETMQCLSYSHTSAYMIAPGVVGTLVNLGCSTAWGGRCYHHPHRECFPVFPDHCCLGHH